MIKNNIIRAGTWNVRGIGEKIEDLISEFEKANLGFLVLTETKMKSKGIKRINGHILIYSGVETNIHGKEGVGCIINKDWEKRLVQWECINERILTVTFKISDTKLTVVAVYGPNEDDKIDNKRIFWEKLQAVVDSINTEIWVAGDLNGRVGKNVQGLNVVGKYV